MYAQVIKREDRSSLSYRTIVTLHDIVRDIRSHEIYSLSISAPRYILTKLPDEFSKINRIAKQIDLTFESKYACAYMQHCAYVSAELMSPRDIDVARFVICI